MVGKLLLLSGALLLGCREAEPTDEFDPPPFEHPTEAQLHESSRRAVRTLLPLAQDGDPRALAILNENYARYEISSMERADIAEVFGKQRYEPAAEQLAESVGAASMNLGWAAHMSLCAIFPDAARSFPTPEETADYWRDYLEKHPPRGR